METEGQLERMQMNQANRNKIFYMRIEEKKQNQTVQMNEWRLMKADGGKIKT